MNIGEIKIESLRLMNANDENLNVANLDTYKQDDRYREYLDKMPGAINRALSRFATYKVMPTKMVEVKPSQGKTLKQFLRLDLKEIIDDFGSLERISYIHERVLPNIDFQTISDGVVIVPFSSSYVYKGQASVLPENPNAGDAYYIDAESIYWTGDAWERLEEDELFGVEYTPKLQMIDANTLDSDMLSVPESLARVIPYFIKADIYEQDEPEIAAIARNIFESALTEYISFGMDRKQRQQYVKNEMW
jgi:hypothetical protein